MKYLIEEQGSKAHTQEGHSARKLLLLQLPEIRLRGA